jgi:hypothetical protein
MATIHCTVSDCGWWGDGNYCTASSILVTTEKTPQGLNSMGKDAETVEGTPAGNKTSTLCYTYVPVG